MPDLSQQLRTDIGAQVDVLYRDRPMVWYDPAVHAISENLNAKYQCTWQSQMRGTSFKDEVAKLLVREMYSRGYSLNREEKNPATGEVRVPSVKRQKVRDLKFRKPDSRIN